jgi:hypothetical protein
LGGLEMATEFFRLHPQFVRFAMIATMMHFKKGGAAHKGAKLFFERRIQPQLRADRIAANDILDTRD